MDEFEPSISNIYGEDDEMLRDQVKPEAFSMSNSNCSNLGGGRSPPGRGPSFMRYNGNTGLYPAATHSFDYNVVKCLDSVFDDTTTTDIEEEKLKTFLRIRPSKAQGTKVANGKSKSRKKTEKVIQVKDETTVIAYPLQKNLLSFLPGRGNRKRTEFKFTKVFGEDAGQSDVFEECVRPLIDNFLNGENCLIFSYGATNSGKTYTLQGHGSDYGIIPRALDAIFNRMQDKVYRTLDIKPYLYQSFQQITSRDREWIQAKKEKLLAEANVSRKEKPYKPNFTGSFADSDSSKCSSLFNMIGASPFDEMNYALFANSMLYSIWVSFAELYNERVYDLLDTVFVGKNKRRKELRLLQDKSGFVYIKDLTEIQVLNDEETYKIFLAGRKNLQFAATQMNQNSSRSHSFFTLRVVTIGIGEGLLPFPKSVHRITFCDLAGMERVYQTENEGLRLKESGTINTSLTMLLKVIRILREKQRNGNNMIETIPFRESKLTHIFKSFFTSSTHIRMIVNVNPDPSTAESTLQVLHNSAIASNVIAFRPVDVAESLSKEILVENAELEENTKPKPARTKKVHFDSFSESTDEDKISSRSSPPISPDSSTSDPPTVVATTKVLQQRVQELEAENACLRRLVTQLIQEKDHLREQSVKLLADQNRLWRNRYEEIQLVQETLNNRRISLLARQVISPGSKCGRSNTPPIRDLDAISEYEEELGESDKENKPPKCH